MAAKTRLDELKDRYHENPRRFFAPYANEYRKNGFVDRAILILEKGLGEQPQNMNGLVVYGQCLVELGRLDEARLPFERALGLDPENLIALRNLGDIARLGGDAPTARSWYEKLLEVDRRNDEVIELLKQVGGGEEQPDGASQAPNIVSVAGNVSVAGGAEAIGMIDLEPAAPAPTPAPRRSTPAFPPRAATPPAIKPVTPARTATPVDPSAKTVEVSAQPKPARRGSLMDVSFDFGEVGVDAASAPAPKAPEPLLAAEAAEYGFARPEEAPSAEDALDSLLDEVPSAPVPRLSDATPVASLIDTSPEAEPLSQMGAIDGLETADYTADVSPLSDLEPSEFQSGDVAPLADLESAEFAPPATPSMALEEVETVEFVPPPLPIPTSGEVEPVAPMPELPSIEDEEDDSFHETPLEQLTRTSTAGLPLLEPLGVPTPADTPTVDDLPLLPSMDDMETVPLSAADVRRRVETPATFVTETMAQVYIQQGHTDKAIEVYRQLIAQSPGDEGLKARLRALEAPSAPTPAAATPIVSAPAVPTPAAATPIVTPSVPDRMTLGFETPLGNEPVEEAPPANAMLSAMSFDGVALSTPGGAPQRPSIPPARAVTPAAPVPVAPSEAPATGPSAREFFGGFARRAATPLSTPAVSLTPTVNGEPMSPLDDLFGAPASADDERAAHRLAAIGATSGPSGGSALDSLFGEGPSAPMPSMTTPSRGTVPRASEKLKFDQFFSAPDTEPIVERASAAQPEVDPASVEHPSAQPGDEPRKDDDDLDQFHGWLKGLTQ